MIYTFVCLILYHAFLPIGGPEAASKDIFKNSQVLKDLKYTINCCIKKTVTYVGEIMLCRYSSELGIMSLAAADCWLLKSHDSVMGCMQQDTDL